MPLRYWTDAHYTRLHGCGSFAQLSEIALDVLRSMPQPIGQVCGPISTGGLGSLEKNLDVFHATIERLVCQDVVVFNQMPFESVILAMRSGYESAQESNQALLDEFYFPIFSSGLVRNVYFIHGWESSYGAKWEREQALRFDINIIDLPKGFLSR